MPGEDFIQSQMLCNNAGSIQVNGFSSNVNGAASSTTQTLNSTLGLLDGDYLYFATTGAQRQISSVLSGTQVLLTATISTTHAEVVTRDMFISRPEATGMVFVESGAACRVFLVPPSDASLILGKMWFIYSSESSAPFEVRINGGTSINGTDYVTISNAYECAVLACSPGGVYSCWTLPVSA